jgi:hypothetical protein
MCCREIKGLSGTWPILLGTLATMSCRAFGIATGYGLDDRGIRVLVPLGSRIFISPYHPDRLWGPPSLLSNWY